ncbi:fibrillarin-like rRNA/tRNA 2'-O-methyltransferase [Methanopyrus sp.]
MVEVEIEPHEEFEGVYWAIFEDGRKKPATENLVPGHQVYGEKLVEYDGKEYRVWEPRRSKLAAMIMNDMEYFPFEEGSRVLYLGAAAGTTPSHVSDIIKESGVEYCVEFASRMMQELIPVCEKRPNMVPILGDATKPHGYAPLVEQVDVIYQDIAQPKQAEVVADNAEAFLRPGGYVIVAIKARSIDVTKEPEDVFEDEERKLEERGFEVLEVIDLEPYERDHVGIVAEYHG